MPRSRESLGHAFNRLWSASLLNNLADGILRTAVPIYAITLTENPVLISLLAAMAFLPWLFFAVIIGTIADRVDRRALLFFSNLARVIILALMGGLIATEMMNIHLLLLLVFLVSIFEVSIDTTTQSMIPEILKKEDLERGNSRLYLAETVVSGFMGSPISGFLYAIAIVLPFFGATAGYLVALIVLAFFPYANKSAESERKAERDGFIDELKFGITFLFKSKGIRTLVLITTTLAFFFAASSSTIALFMVKELGLDPKFFGVVLAIQGIGGLIGGAMANRISTKFTRGRALASVMMMASFLTLFTGFVTSIELFIALAVLSTFGSTIWNILLMSTYQLLIPNHLYGRIHGARRTIVWGTIPIGSVFGGFLATFGLRTPLIVGGLGLIVVTTVAFKFIVSVTNSTLEPHDATSDENVQVKGEERNS